MNHERVETLVWLKAVIAAAAVLPMLTFAGAIWYLHQQAKATAGFRIERAARVSEEHALKVFETNTALLSRTLDLLGDQPDVQLQAREAVLHAQLRRMTEGLPQMQGIYVIGSAGRMIATDRRFPAPRDIDYSDRVSFSHHRANGAQPFISELLTSRATGEQFFDMSVRRSHAAGQFGGTLSASMTPKYFAEFYRELTGNDGELKIALLRADGAVLARWPKPPTASDVPGKTPSHMKITATTGEVRAEPVSLPEGVSGLLASRQLRGYPVYVATWIDDAAIRAIWLHQAALLAALMIPVTIGLVLSARVALQKTRRSLEAAEKLRVEVRQREQVEETLRQAQKLEAMGRLTGGVAHDFNNLLMIVSNSLYILARLHPQLQGSRPMASIEHAIASGAKLTRQLLSFSRRQPFRPEIIRLQERLPAILELVRPALGASVPVAGEVAPLTAPIEVDVAELELALLNLAINAKDAMPGGGKLQIEAADATAAEVPTGLTGAFVRVTVSDEGEGISAEDLARVFEPFFTTKPAGHGTGLGLSQVYGFCQRAGGAVHIVSREGEGTQVQLFFPARSQVPSEAAAQEIAPRKTLTLSVLLAEDNLDVASASVAVLESLGCTVHHAVNGDEALQALQRSADRYDLLLSDIVMPGNLNGLALARHVLSAFPRLPVLLMSGYSESAAEAGALGLDVVPKPCTPATLVAAMEKALGRASA